MKVSIIGTGYVGLVTGACLADKGHQIICVDVDEEKINKINHTALPFYEPGLGELLNKNIGVRLTATTDLHQSVVETDITFITVGTPFNGKEIDLTYLKDAATQIGQALKGKNTYHLVVLKSTVVPGTTDEVVRPILETASGRKAGVDFGVGMNPEFLTEGEAVQDFMFPDRIIFGGIDDQSRHVLEELYIPFAGAERIRTNNKTAEMIKYTSNALLATMISFSNELGNLCAALRGVDVVDVMRGLHSSKYLSPVLTNGDRITPPIAAFLWAGCGFGGSCLPKDVKALIAHGEKARMPMRLLDAVIRVNEDQPQQVFSLLKRHFPSFKGIRIAVLGLAFRPDTDDMRESPAIPIITGLLAHEAEIQAYDPVAKQEAAKVFGDSKITLCDSMAEVIRDVQAIVLVTRWEEFRSLPKLLEDLDPQPVVIDGRRMLDKSSIAKYEGIGL